MFCELMVIIYQTTRHHVLEDMVLLRNIFAFQPFLSFQYVSFRILSISCGAEDGRGFDIVR